MPRTPRVVGLDVSMSSTGIAWSHRGETTRITTKKNKNLPHDGIHERLETLTIECQRAAAGCDLAVIETANYGAPARGQSSTYHQLAGFWWHAAQAVWRAGIPYARVAPSSLKLYATGNGGSATDKKAMLAAARAAFPRIPVANHDAADALWLAALGSEALGRPLVRGTPRQRAVAHQIELPPHLDRRRLRAA